MAIKHGLIMSVPKEPGSDEYVARSISPSDVLDSELVAELRDMAREGATVPDLVRRVQRHHGLANGDAFLPIVYLRYTFWIGINQAKDITLGSQFLMGTYSDTEVDQMVMPHILAARERWDGTPGADTDEYDPSCISR